MNLATARLALSALLAACAGSAVAGPPPGHPSPDTAAQMMKLPPVSDSELTRTGTVVQAIDANEYTYIEVSIDKGSTWLAAPLVALGKGDRIRFDDGAVMNNFYSKLLKRTFPSVMFVNRVKVAK